MIQKALKLLRKYHACKQKDLAKKLGISPARLSEIESDGKGVSFDMLKKYSEVFRIPVSSITFFEEATEVENRAKLTSIPNKVLRLLEWLDTVTELEDAKEAEEEEANARS